MYEEIITLTIISILLFFVYFFYKKIDNFIKKNIINSQNVNKIKEEMQNLENIPNESNKIYTSEYNKIIENISEILNLPIDFIYKITVTYGRSIFYNLSYKNI
jgi:predicted PurR-regulated permease PerM